MMQGGREARGMREQLLRPVVIIPREKEPHTVPSPPDLDGQEANTTANDVVLRH